MSFRMKRLKKPAPSRAGLSFGAAGLSPQFNAEPARGQPPGMLDMSSALGNQAMGELLTGTALQSKGLSLLGPVSPPQLLRGGPVLTLTVHFAKGQFQLDPANAQAVDGLAAELKTMSQPTVSVDAHTYGEGDAEQSHQLSQARRELVIATLAKDLAPQPAFGGEAHVEAQPSVDPSTQDAAAQKAGAGNRRATIVVIPKRGGASLAPDQNLRLLMEAGKLDLLDRPSVKQPELKVTWLNDLADDALDEVLDDILKRFVKDKAKREKGGPLLRNAIKAGLRAGVKKAIETFALEPKPKDDLTRYIEQRMRERPPARPPG